MSMVLLVFNFVSDFEDYIGKAPAGIVVEPIVGAKNNGGIIMSHPKIQSDIVRVMGFGGEKDYKRAYPGGFDIESVFIKELYKYAALPILQSDPSYINIHDTCSASDSQFYALHNVRQALTYYDSPEIVVSPTVEEVRQCEYINEMGNDELWFCSDWVDL